MPGKENVCAVIARYNEDLLWTLEYPFNQFDYIVYNKGNNEDFEKAHVKQIVKLPNIGKECHTYLYHVIQNYHSLAPIQVFLPGSVNLQHDGQNKKALAKKLLQAIIDSRYQDATFVYCPTQRRTLLEEFENFTLDHWCCSESKNRQLNSESLLLPSPLRPFGNWYRHYIGNLPVNKFIFWGIFSMDKRDILKHPVERYQRIIECVSTHSNPETTHYIERAWAAIFGPLVYTKKQKD
jgi:hypothetical protein